MIKPRYLPDQIVFRTHNGEKIKTITAYRIVMVESILRKKLEGWVYQLEYHLDGFDYTVSEDELFPSFEEAEKDLERKPIDY